MLRSSLKSLGLALVCTVVLAGAARSGEVDVIDVRVVKSGDSYRFDVTVQHESCLGF